MSARGSVTRRPRGPGGLFLLPVALSGARDAPMRPSPGVRVGAILEALPCGNQDPVHAGLQMPRPLGAHEAQPSFPPRQPMSVMSGTTPHTLPCGGKCGK